MRILGFMGSPRTKGLCAQFTESALSGAASRGAEVKQFNLAKYHIKYCRGCYKCVHKNHELPSQGRRSRYLVPLAQVSQPSSTCWAGSMTLWRARSLLTNMTCGTYLSRR